MSSDYKSVAAVAREILSKGRFSETTEKLTISGAGGTVAGAFLCNAATGTTGILFSEGDFTGGDKIVASGDTVNVTYTFSADAV